MKNCRHLPIAIACALISACGGGSGGGTQSPTTPTTPTTSSETINGIVVPLEPPPALRNASLVGVDSNSNGVRDDVERLLAGTTRNQIFDGPTLAIASEYHKLATQTLSASEIVGAYRRIACQDRLRTDTDRLVMPAEDIRDNTADTVERRQKLNANDKTAVTAIEQIEGDFPC